MKYALFAFVCTIAFGACTQSGSVVVQNGRLDLEHFEKTPIPNTGAEIVIRRNADGKVLEEGIVENGQRQGTWVIYHEDREVPRTVANFHNDLYNGTYFELNKQGQVDLQCSYVNNLLNGFFCRYRLGRKTEEGFYVNGQMDGVYKKYYESRSIVQQEATYRHGKLHGKSRYFDDQGDLLVEYDYEDGEKVGGGIVQSDTAEGEK